MGLIKNKANDDANVTAAANVTEEEVMTETATVTETAVQTATPAAAPAVAASGGKGQFFMNTPTILEVVAEADTNTFDRITATNGEFRLYRAQKSLGKAFEFKAVAEKKKFSISPNGSPGDGEAAQYFDSAYEGQLSFKGNEIEESLQAAKDAGYDKAKITEYLDVFALITDATDNADEVKGEIVVIQLSPTSKSAWISFKSGLLMKAEMGLPVFGTDGEPPTLRATAKVETNAKKQSFTNAKFSLA